MELASNIACLEDTSKNFQNVLERHYMFIPGEF